MRSTHYPGARSNTGTYQASCAVCTVYTHTKDEKSKQVEIILELCRVLLDITGNRSQVNRLPPFLASYDSPYHS